VHENGGEICSTAQTWSVDVFLSAGNDFPGKKFFLIFPKKFAQIFEILFLRYRI
jgi:hypothetical protein